MSRTGALVGALGACALALAALAGFSVCPFALLTGIPCPGCGLGRAALALLSGRPADAMRFHPLVLVVLPALATLVGFEAMRARGERWSPRAERIASVSSVVLFAAVFGVWILRFEGAFGGPVPVRTIFRTTEGAVTR